MSDQPKTTAADQPPSGKDHRKPCLCNGICLGKEHLHSNRVCQEEMRGKDLPDGPGVWKRTEGDWEIIVQPAKGVPNPRFNWAGFADGRFKWGWTRGDDSPLPRGNWFPAQADAANWQQRAAKLERDLELQREVSAELGRQNEQLIGSTTDLPREIQEMIYRSSCCVPTPEAAQKEPCACVAYAIVEKVEEWAGAQATKRDEEAEAELDRERMRLAACGVAALGYFNGCHDDYRSGSLDDVLQLNAQLTAANERLAKVRDALTRLAKWAELSPFAESILAEAQAALAEGER